MRNKWLQCQNCKEVLQAREGYVEREYHSCWNHVPQTRKMPVLVKLSKKEVRLEIDDCRAEMAAIGLRVRDLLAYERTLDKS